uniref:Uncharacterized protein n=1 Tax=Hanusia phi TaxID=3032 RepID=A0A7S0F0Y9_9CRYP
MVKVCDRTPPMDLASDRQLIRELEILKEICATPSTSLTNDTWRTSTKPLTAETSRNERYLALTKRPSTSECPNERWARQTPTRYENLRDDGKACARADVTVAIRLDNTNSFREMNIFSLQSDLADELCQAEGIARNRIAFYDLDSRKVREMRDRYQAIYLTFAVLPPTKKAFSPSRSSQDVAMSILQQVRTKAGHLLHLPLASNIIDCQVITSSTEPHTSPSCSPRRLYMGQQIVSCHPTKLTMEAPPRRPKTQGGLLLSTVDFAEKQNAVLRAKQKLALAERRAYTAAELARRMAISLQHQLNK